MLGKKVAYNSKAYFELGEHIRFLREKMAEIEAKEADAARQVKLDRAKITDRIRSLQETCPHSHFDRYRDYVDQDRCRHCEACL